MFETGKAKKKKKTNGGAILDFAIGEEYIAVVEKRNVSLYSMEGDTISTIEREETEVSFMNMGASSEHSFFCEEAFVCVAAGFVGVGVGNILSFYKLNNQAELILVEERSLRSSIRGVCCISDLFITGHLGSGVFAHKMPS